LEEFEQLCYVTYVASLAVAVSHIVLALVEDELPGYRRSAKFWLINRCRQLFGKIPLPVPKGSPVDVVKLMLPILCELSQLRRSNPTIRRTLSAASLIHDDLVTIGGEAYPSAHDAAFDWAGAVHQHVWCGVLGLEGYAQAGKRTSDSLDPSSISDRHWRNIRRECRALRRMASCSVECLTRVHKELTELWELRRRDTQ
jgi:hypothetical protein